MKKYFIFLLLLLNLGIIYSDNQTQDIQEKKDQENKEFKNTLVKKIEEINLKSFENERWDFNTNSFVEFVNKAMEILRKPKAFDKRESAFGIFEKVEDKSCENLNFKDLSSVWQDLDLFCGKKDKSKYLCNSIDRAVTELGKISFYLLISTPTTDIDLLKKRQQVIKTILNNPEILKNLNNSFQEIKKSENYLISIFLGERDWFKRDVKEKSFKTFKFMNNSDIALMGKYLMDSSNRLYFNFIQAFASLVLCGYGTYLAVGDYNNVPKKLENWVDDYKGQGHAVLVWPWKLKNRWIHASIALLSGIYCALNLKYTFDWAYGELLLEIAFQEITSNIANVMDNIYVTYSVINKYPELRFFPEFYNIIDFYENKINKISKIKELLNLFDSKTFEKPRDFFVNKGAVIKAYSLLYSLDQDLRELITSVSRVDAYLSLAKLVKECENKKVKFCFPEYISGAEKPFIKFSNFWHPLVDENKIVTNSIELGLNNNRANIILTGPNEGGKSTVLKSIILSVLMAQTCGISPAGSLQFTPFKYISTYLNITDDIGAGNSLFKAEVLRAQQLIDQISNSKKGEFSLSVFDEVFNGTSPTEGSAAAYSVAKHLGQFDQSICLISTHFALLTDLEKDSNSFENYKVSVIKNSDNSITYPYILEHGYSQQHVALDILQNQGFAGDIVDSARNLVDKISKN